MNMRFMITSELQTNQLCLPVCSNFNNIVRSAKQGSVKWPCAWKLEYGTPLQKIPDPLTEDD